MRTICMIVFMYLRGDLEAGRVQVDGRVGNTVAVSGVVPRGLQFDEWNQTADASTRFPLNFQLSELCREKESV